MADPNEYASRSPARGGYAGIRAREARDEQVRGAQADSNNGIPWDIGGHDANAERQRQTGMAGERERWWTNLQMPTAEELAQQYDYNSRGGAGALSAQESALSQLGSWAHGGLTGADRAMMESTRARDAQAARAQQQALMQQMQARGMGGSGADLATQMMASQLGQQQASDAESQMMQGAQQRALSAVQAQAQLGGQMRQLSQHETEHQQDANSSAIQQAFQNQVTQASGANNAMTGLAQNSQQASQQQSRNSADAAQAGASAVGSLLGML